MRKVIMVSLILFILGITPCFAKDSNKFKKNTRVHNGIGIFIEKTKAGYEIKGIIKFSPAEGKLLLGDVIISVNGMFTQQRNLYEVEELITKKEGTPIKLIVRRNNKEVSVSLKTKQIKFVQEDVVGEAPELEKYDKKEAWKITQLEVGKGFFINDTTGKFRYKTGSVFSVFKDNKRVGFARVREIYGSKTFFILIEGKNLNHSELYKYRLVYYCYKPVIGSPITEMDMNVKSESDMTPLHFAAFIGRIDSAKLLISQGADVNAKGDSGWTPLHLAALTGSTGMSKLFIDNGADVNAKDNAGMTPLHNAAFGGSIRVTRLLIYNGVDVNAKDNTGWTPLHFAAFRGSISVARLLVSRGADVSARIKKGKYKDKTPLKFAIEKGHKDIADLLRSHGGKE